MSPIKLKDFNGVPLEEVRRKLDKKYEKLVCDDEINETGKELSIDEMETNLVNNVVPKLEEFDELSRRNAHFMRPTNVPARRTTSFSFVFIPRKATTFEEISS